nr:hypothetical protein OG781_31065 [Streptomyces sp. NBC_00830]
MLDFLGVPGVPSGAVAEDEREFVGRWVGWIATWIAQEAESRVEQCRADR